MVAITVVYMRTVVLDVAQLYVTHYGLSIAVVWSCPPRMLSLANMFIGRKLRRYVLVHLHVGTVRRMEGQPERKTSPQHTQ